MKWSKIIDGYNNDTLDIESIFGDIKTFFEIIGKKGLLGELNPDFNHNQLLLAYKKFDEPKFIEQVLTCLRDVDLIDGKFFYETSSREDLAELFSDSGRNSSRNIVRRILSEDSDGDYFDYFPENVYGQVVAELNKVNLEILKRRIYEELKDIVLEPSTDLLEQLSVEQGNDEGVRVTADNVSKILDDEETMNELFRSELSELKSDLGSIYSNAYNQAYESELWDDIWNELQTYFVGQGEWFNVKQINGKEKFYFRIEIRNFLETIIDFTEVHAKYSTPNICEENFIGILTYNDSLRFYPPDYADPSKVDRNINELFGDYIY